MKRSPGATLGRRGKNDVSAPHSARQARSPAAAQSSWSTGLPLQPASLIQYCTRRVSPGSGRIGECGGQTGRTARASNRPPSYGRGMRIDLPAVEYFGRFRFPERLDDEWLRENVHAMDEREWAAFMY